MIKPINDNSKYLIHKLSNGIKCLLIHDDRANKSAMSVNVHTGSYNDYKNYQGVSHLVEHVLFLDKKKGNQCNFFSKFLTANNGMSNAYTKLSSTNYFFDVNHNAFDKAINIFSNFFISPQIEEKEIYKEINAVHSEHMKNMSNDNWRVYQLTFSSTKMYRDIFPTGNRDTLNKKNIKKVIEKYISDFYNANNINIVALSALPLDRQIKFLAPFNKINISEKNKGKVFERHNVLNQNKFCKVVPISSNPRLIFRYFINDNINSYVDGKPYEIVTALINSKRKGSLFDLLFTKGLISDLSSDVDNYGEQFASFDISIDLTNKGENEYMNVMNLVTSYIAQMVNCEINKKYIKELRDMNKVRFKFKEKEEPINYVVALAERMTTIKNSNRLLISPYEYSVTDSSINNIKKFFNYIKKDNLSVYFLTKNNEKDYVKNPKKYHTEKWYHTKYSNSPLPLFNPIKDKLFTYPCTNKYIPHILTLLDKKAKKFPSLIYKSPLISVYYKSDDKFKVPKTMIHLRLRVNKVSSYDKVVSRICCHLWTKIINHLLKDELDLMSEAGVNVSIAFDVYGVRIQIRGYSEHIKMILLNVINKLIRITKGENTNELYNIFYDEYCNDIKNYYVSSPYRQVGLEYIANIDSNGVSIRDIASFLKCNSKQFIFQNYFKEYCQSITKTGKILLLIQGNINKDDAKSLSTEVERKINVSPLSNEKIKVPMANILQRNKVIELSSQNIKEKNDALLSFYQINSNSIKDSVSISLLSSLLKEKYFTSLRTSQSIGYIVSLFPSFVFNSQGICLLAQSNVKSPKEISHLNKIFLKEHYQYINKIKDEEFNQHRESIQKELERKDNSLNEEFERNANEIERNEFLFDRREKEGAVIKRINKEDIRTMFSKVFINGKKLEIQLWKKGIKL